MPANRNLGPMFHGSNHEFNPGDTVEPRDMMTPTAGIAWASTNKDVASSYGKHLYEVEPADDVKRQAGTGKEFGIYNSSKGFKVIRKV
jgi:hypothetical protein